MMHTIFRSNSGDSNASCIRRSYSDRSRAHLAVSTEWVSSETNKNSLCKSSSPFTMGLYGSLYDCHHVALIATSHVSLITSFLWYEGIWMCKCAHLFLQERLPPSKCTLQTCYLSIWNNSHCKLNLSLAMPNPSAGGIIWWVANIP